MRPSLLQAEAAGSGITCGFGGVEAVVGLANFHERVTDGVRAWQEHEVAPDGAASGTS